MTVDLKEMAESRLFTADEVMSAAMDQLEAESFGPILELAAAHGWLRYLHSWMGAVAEGAEMVRGGARALPTDQAQRVAKTWLGETLFATTKVDLMDERGARVPLGTTVLAFRGGGSDWLCRTEDAAPRWARAHYGALLPKDPLDESVRFDRGMQALRFVDTMPADGTSEPPRRAAAA